MTTPKRDNFYMPAEYAPHAATIMIWCERGGSWIYGARYARPVFAEMIKAISRREKVYLAVSEKGKISALGYLQTEVNEGRVELVGIPTDDSWARDMAPTFVTDGREVRAVDWAFNAWGGDYNGLYKDYQSDDAFAAQFAKRYGCKCYPARPFVLEGGSVHTNGKGTILTTEECLLSPGRNPQLTKEEIGEKLKEYLGAERVVWLPYGVEGDETDGHVDNICAFVSENEVVLGWTEEGEQGRRCRADLEALKAAGLTVHKLPFPKTPVCFTQFEVDGFSPEEGEDMREVGEKLAASYVNFYVCNGAVLVPQFGDENDGVAVRILSGLFPGREVVPVYARQLIIGGGNIHCLTQQIPAPSQKEK